MSKSYQAKYKCRLCGEHEYGGITGQKIADRAVTELAFSGKCTQTMGPALLWPHDCKNGSVGIADFVGFEAMEDDDEKHNP